MLWAQQLGWSPTGTNLPRTNTVTCFSGSETNITLNPGTYIITAYGAPGGDGNYGGAGGGSEPR